MISSPAKQWTFLFYNAGQGPLAEIGTHALQELERVGSDAHTDVVAFNYREHTPFGCFEKYEGGRTYHLQKQSSTLKPRGELGSLLSCALSYPGRLQSPVLDTPVAAGEAARVSAGEPLKSFLLQAMKRFPAQHFALTLTGHGAAFQGQLVTRGPDGRAALSNDELARVLREVKEETGQGIDLVNLNTCYSANLETLYSLKDATSIVVASQDALALGTQPFAAVLADVQKQLAEGGKVDSRQLGRTFVEEAARQPLHSLYTPTLTAVDAGSLGRLGAAVAQLQQSCLDHGISSGQVRDCLQRAVAIDFAEGSQVTDLGSLADSLANRFPELREAAQEVKNALSQAVVAEQHGDPTEESGLAKLVRKVPGLVGPQKDLRGATGMTVFWDGGAPERRAFIEESAFGRDHPPGEFLDYLRAD